MPRHLGIKCGMEVARILKEITKEFWMDDKLGRDDAPPGAGGLVDIGVGKTGSESAAPKNAATLSRLPNGLAPAAGS